MSVAPRLIRRDHGGVTTSLYRPSRAVAILFIVLGLAGWIVSFLLYLEYTGQLMGTEPLISCQLSVVVTCGPNLLSPGGNLLGFSNSILGITLFLGPVFAGVSALATPGGMRAWYWRTFGIFVLGGFALVHFFAWRSIYEYGSLCPWCMIVWLVTIPLFWVTLGWQFRDGVWGKAPERLGAAILSWSPLIVILDYLLIAVAAQLRLDVIGTL